MAVIFTKNLLYLHKNRLSQVFVLANYEYIKYISQLNIKNGGLKTSDLFTNKNRGVIVKYGYKKYERK